MRGPQLCLLFQGSPVFPGLARSLFMLQELVAVQLCEAS